MRILPGGRTIAGVICPCCSHCFEIEFNAALGREGSLLREELRKRCQAEDGLLAKIAAIQESARREEARLRSDAAMTASALQFRVAGLEDERGVLLARIEDVSWRLAEASGGHDPADTAKIAKLEADLRECQRLLAYYETPNARRGMRPLTMSARKKFDAEQEAACSRVAGGGGGGGGGYPLIGAAMGHTGFSYRLQLDGAEKYRATECGTCGSVSVEHLRYVPRLYREFDDDKAPSVLRDRLLLIEHVICLGCGAETAAPGSPAIEGTCFGPVALSRIIALYLERGVDRSVSKLFRTLYGCEIGTVALWNARRAFEPM